MAPYNNFGSFFVMGSFLRKVSQFLLHYITLAMAHFTESWSYKHATAVTYLPLLKVWLQWCHLYHKLTLTYARMTCNATKSKPLI